MQPVNLLMVDDEQDFLRTMEKRLSRRGMNVATASSGAEALDRLEQFSADVVVLDVKMPGMDGIETLKAIRQKHPLTEVIMLTGHASMNVAVEGMQLGAFHYLMKPAEINELVFKIEDAHKRKMLREKQVREDQPNNVR
ncbi:response regulator [Pseudodesulfovibrio senegalensis]|uniref:Response regulator n=1 Tax=Pseudodesulfovibrio senegalensis TaxID=1721087 RepID=A0A6N6N588_9BACT|nr:response regulator [Pseudodesulfovibrio senegalensis]KAB1442901.1 response regulator [Pseudodesulfovibrio senegalensis]